MDELLLFCQRWAKEHGYTVFKAHSNANKNIYILCDCLGKYCGSIMNASRSKNATSKTMCPFKVKGSIPTRKKITNKTWTLDIQHGKHNHEASSDPSSHASHKRLLPEQYNEIQKVSQSNLKPAQILLQLQTSDNETYATNKKVSNALQKICCEDLDGRLPIEALLCILKETNWSYDVKVKDDGVVQNLFFAHPGLIHLAWINHHVALLDSTYKTNRYQMPLLHVIGQAASNQLFSIVFCFLACKDSESYIWAINNLKKHVWRPQRIPKVFVTNCDNALRPWPRYFLSHKQIFVCGTSTKTSPPTSRNISLPLHLKTKKLTGSLEGVLVPLGPSHLC
jgi:hypothetical protein